MSLVLTSITIILLLIANLVWMVRLESVVRKRTGHIKQDAKTIKHRLKESHNENWRAMSLIFHLKPKRPLPVPGNWAASSEFLLELTRIIEDERPDTVLELGSGLSTLTIAYALDQIGGGRLVSVDHDEYYGRKTSDELVRHGLDHRASVRIAPLMNQDGINEGLPWYDLTKIGDIESLDLLVIDGPPVAYGAMIRYAAVSVFKEKFSAKAIIMLDDANREGEQEVLAKWQQELPRWKYSLVSSSKGLAIFKRSHAYA